MSGDAPLRSIEPARVAGGLGERALRAVRNMVDDDRALIGYAIIGLRDDGFSFVATSTQIPDGVPLNRHMFVGMAAELIRDSMIAEETAMDVVNRANGFDD